MKATFEKSLSEGSLSKGGEPAPQRIVVRGVNWLGDAVMSSAALVRLRAAHPQAAITLLISEKIAEIWRHHPGVDDLWPIAAGDRLGQIARRLRAGRFDTALIFPNSFRSALECWLGRIPVRVGFPGNLRSPLLTRIVSRPAPFIRMRKRPVGEIQRLVRTAADRPRETFPESAHHLHHYLALAAALGANPAPVAPAIHILEPEKATFRSRFMPAMPPGRPVIGLNPGAEYGPAKRWPAERFVRTALEVDRRTESVFLIFGGKNDRAAAGEIERGLRGSRAAAAAVNLAGETTLRELGAGLACCDAVLVNDTGPMHLAAAVGTRVVTPFGSTAPELTGPGWPGRSVQAGPAAPALPVLPVLLLGRAPCAPCFRRECPIDQRCLTSITVEEAAGALLEILRSTEKFSGI